MRQLLKLHPGSRCLAPTRIEVGIERPHVNNLVLSYVMTGKMSDILMPPVLEATRRDELWRHTCFEAFLRASSAPDYYEFNFSPSTQWAAYRFSGYRNAMRAADEVDSLPIEFGSDQDHYTLQASLDLDCLSGLSRAAPWRLGLSALIEDTSGCRSYWALSHPPGEPDFHHADNFAIELRPAVQP